MSLTSTPAFSSSCPEGGHKMMRRRDLLKGFAAASLVAAAGGASSLFIDVIGRPATPLSVAGVHRRERRRVARAVVR